MAAEVREAEQKAITSDSDSSSQTGFLETNEIPIPGKSDNALFFASDSYEDLTLPNGGLPTIAVSGSIHTIKRKAKRSDTIQSDATDESSNATKDSEISGEDSQDDNIEVISQGYLFSGNTGK